jgi:hypothetical protein
VAAATIASLAAAVGTPVLAVATFSAARSANTGIGYREPRRIETADGLSHVFAINVLAPYLLTALITAPDRLVYLRAAAGRGSSLGAD